DVSFTLVGAGDSFHDLTALTRTLGLDDALHFTGRIPDAEVETLLATADVCVSPDPKNPLNDVSTMNKVLEYMACGRAIVAYDLKEHRESAGEGALYAEPNRVEDLADKIAILLDDRGRRERSGEHHRRPGPAHTAWEHGAGELRRAYEALCRPNRGR